MRLVLSNISVDECLPAYLGGPLDGMMRPAIEKRQSVLMEVLLNANGYGKPYSSVWREKPLDLVQPLDVFVFYGRFLRRIWKDGAYVPTGRPFQAVCGFMQVGKLFNYESPMDSVGHGTLYVGSACLDCGGMIRNKGYGALAFDERLLLENTPLKNFSRFSGLDLVTGRIEQLTPNEMERYVEWILNLSSMSALAKTA